MNTFSINSAPRRLVAMVALSGILACSNSNEPGDPLGNGTIATSTAGVNLRIRNVSTAALRVGVVTQQQYKYGLAQYCFGYSSCGQLLQAGQSIDVGREGLTGASQSPTPVYVFYWPQGISNNTTPAPVSRIDAALPPTQ